MDYNGDMDLEQLEKSAREYAIKDQWNHEAGVVNQKIIAKGRSPYLVNAYCRLAKCYAVNGFESQAIALFKKVIAISPENEIALHFLQNPYKYRRRRSKLTIEQPIILKDNKPQKVYLDRPKSAITCPICGGTGQAASESFFKYKNRMSGPLSICKTCMGKRWINPNKTDFD